MKEVGKKPVIGIQLSLCTNESTDHEPTNIDCGTAILYCKDYVGWKELLKLVRYINQPDRLSGHPRIGVSEFVRFNTDHWICVGVSLGLAAGKHLRGQFRHYYDGVNPFEKSEVKYTSTVVPVTYNAALSREDLDALWAVMRKENSHKTFPLHHYMLNREELIGAGFDIDNFKLAAEIFDLVEEFDIKEKQKLPACPGSKPLREICQEGLRKFGLENNKEYAIRLNNELDVIEHAKMEGYFLIVSDILGFLRNKKRLLGVSRGSAGGCLVSYLTGITSIDPLKYGLYFERFYNAERGGLPDIDMDIPPDSRDSVFDYVQHKYGEDNFAQLSTFGTLKGAAALKLCLNLSQVYFSEQNEITKVLPEEAKIDPQLATQEKEAGTRSLLYWTLVNEPKRLERWCILNKETGFLDGKYATEFGLAIRLDKVIVDRGRHASAFAISDSPLYEKAPVVYDSVSQKHIVGVEMNSAESLGLIKLDLLGLDLLSKAEYMQEVLKNGSVCQSRCW